MKEYYTTAIFDGYFKHFGIQPKTAELYGNSVEDIIEVKITIAEDQSIQSFEFQRDNPIFDYWAFIDKNECISSLIWHQRFLLNMCFPYGIDAAEKHGDGKAYRVNIEKIA